VPNEGETNVLKPDGGINHVPSEPIIVTLNKLGADGWELVQGGVNADSSGFIYMLKRLLP
jgi:hypothetical protein